MNKLTRYAVLASVLLVIFSLSGCAIFKEFDRRAFLLDEGRTAMGNEYYVEALIVYEHLAKLGDPEAQYHFAKLFRDGLGIVHQNTEKALRWYTASADQGYLKAQLYLANLYYKGDNTLGVGRDFTLSARWYRAAAKQGNAYAQNNLGIMYCFGKGVDKDYTQAAHWLRLAANQGRAEAQYNLGALYYSGLGVPEDLVTARHWFSSAAIRGQKKAKSGLAAVAQRLDFNRG